MSSKYFCCVKAIGLKCTSDLLNQHQKISLFLNQGFILNGQSMPFQCALIKTIGLIMFCL